MTTRNKSATKNVPEQPFVIAHKAATLIVVAAIIFVIAGIAWWKQIYNNPRRIFWGMISNNLSLASVTRTSVSVGQTGPVQKIEQVSFVPTMASRTVVTIEQNDDVHTKVTSETIGTATDDYSRYISIDTDQKGTNGKKLDYSKLEGIWGKSMPGSAQYFSQASLGVMPFANLSGLDRSTIVSSMQDHKVYDVDYAKAEAKQVQSRSALVYAVKINTAAYVDSLKAIAKAAGISDTKDLNASDYQGSAPIELKLTVDKTSRKLLEVEYVSGGQKETYSAHGLSQPIQLPSQTIAIDELQKRIQEVQ